MDYTGMTINTLGGLAMFLFGMKVMSEGLQKVAGEKMRHVLSAMTSNRFVGVGTGVVVTSVIQSSSATTVMLVGFVHAGLITVSQSVGVIMGANIGTTFTGWLVAIVGFKLKITAMALPAITIGFIPRFIGNRKLADWGEVLIGFGLLFLGLNYMKEAVESLGESKEIIDWMATCRADTVIARLGAVAVGMIVTFVIQSSSAAMAVIMTLAVGGMPVDTACALALGTNIGTTITSNLAAIGTSVSAKRAARVHLLFNVVGSIWPIVLFVPFLAFVDLFIDRSGSMDKATIAVYLAVFHTLFNIISTVAFIPFTKQLAWLSQKLVFGGAEKNVALKFLDPKVMNSPPMALHAARAELLRMIDEVESMLIKVLKVVSSPDKKMGKVADEVLATEEIVDILEKEISEYLVSVTRLETSLEQSHEITGILHAVSDVERMGDHCESLLRLAKRRYDKKLPLGDRAIKELNEIGARVKEFMDLIRENMTEPKPTLMADARRLEDSINEMRRQMRKAHVIRLNEGSCKVDSGLVFIDMLTSFEKMGDHAFNVAEMLAGER